MKWLALTIAALILPVAGRSSLQAKDAPTDRDALQGTWRMVTRETGGEARETNGMRLVFKDDRFQLVRDDGTIEGTFKIDAAANPRRIDMHVDKAPPDQERVKDKTSLGIYELNGDELRWCAAEPGSETRPTEFSGTGGGCMLAVFKREPAPAK